MRKELKLKAPDAGGFVTPRFAALTADPNASQLIHGMQLMTETRARLPQNVGNDLNCSSCHLNGGTVANGSPFLGIAAFFPSEAPRAGKVISLGERINGCFRRSMHGKPLPVDGPDLQAMVAYIDWMKGATQVNDKVPGRGVAKIARNLLPDPVHGKKVYAEQCAVCHGANGERHQGRQRRGSVPAAVRREALVQYRRRHGPHLHGGRLRQGEHGDGPRSEIPAGPGQPVRPGCRRRGRIFCDMPRPDFPDKVKDWPKGGKPKDARY